LRELARGLSGAPNGFGLLAGLALGGLLIGLALPHFPEDAFALHLLLQHPQGLIDVVVANEYLQTRSPIDVEGNPELSDATLSGLPKATGSACSTFSPRSENLRPHMAETCAEWKGEAIEGDRRA
jgi:hypothetical protein